MTSATCHITKYCIGACGHLYSIWHHPETRLQTKILYGLYARTRNKSDIKSIDFVVYRFFVKLFRAANVTKIRQREERYNLSCYVLFYEKDAINSYENIVLLTMCCAKYVVNLCKVCFFWQFPVVAILSITFYIHRCVFSSLQIVSTIMVNTDSIDAGIARCML